MPEFDLFFQERWQNVKSYTALSGPNNCGKSWTLRQLPIQPSYYLACSRFYQFQKIESLQIPIAEQNNQFLPQHNAGRPPDDNKLPLDHLIGRLSDKNRAALLEICSEIVGERFTIRPLDPNNSFSGAFVEVGGRPIPFTSSGSRLIMMILGLCYDTSLENLMIDEPEIGLSPKTQSIIARYLMDPDFRSKHFPHLKRIFVATHSHIFLDRTDISNNYVVTKNQLTISLSQIKNVAEFHHLQFNMLGNELESMLLPSAIVVVEGESDVTAIGRIFRLRYPDKKISVVGTDTESRMSHYIEVFNKFVGNIATTTPYRSRLFVLLDSVHSMGTNGTIAKLKELGVAESNISILSKNGIEYYYPEDIIAKIFGCSSSQISGLVIDGNREILNGKHLKKTDLAKMVSDELTIESKFGKECEDLFQKVAMATEA